MALRRPGSPIALAMGSGHDGSQGPSKVSAYVQPSERRLQRGAEHQAQPPFPLSVEGLLRHHLEELRFSFGEEPLADLEGFLICEDGCRAIITAADLTPTARIFLYMHCLGHIALGHVDDRRLSVTHEFRDRWRLPPDQQVRETAADDWALSLLAPPPLPIQGAPHPFRHGTLQELHNLRLPAGYLGACHARLRAALAAQPALVAELRRHAAAHQRPPETRLAPKRRARAYRLVGARSG